jgi:AmiR/NasT family two-component response regulator
MPDRPLRVLIADERPELLESLSEQVRKAGHDPVATAIGVSEAAAAVERERPDVAVVGVHQDVGHALDLLDALSTAGDVPVIASLDEDDQEFIAEAAERGVLAQATPLDLESFTSGLRLAQATSRQVGSLTERVRQVEERMRSRAVVERAKGILMERHDVSELEAYQLLRRHAREERRPLVAVAAAVLSARSILPRRPGGGG